MIINQLSVDDQQVNSHLMLSRLSKVTFPHCEYYATKHLFIDHFDASEWSCKSWMTVVVEDSLSATTYRVPLRSMYSWLEISDRSNFFFSFLI